MFRRALLPVIAGLLVELLPFFMDTKPAKALPNNFVNSKVADVSRPTALAFTPNSPHRRAIL